MFRNETPPLLSPIPRLPRPLYPPEPPDEAPGLDGRERKRRGEGPVVGFTGDRRGTLRMDSLGEDRVLCVTNREDDLKRSWRKRGLRLDCLSKYNSIVVL